MFGISGEHLLILGIVLLIFGPRRLPELGNTLGKAIRNFKDAISGVEEASFRRIDNNPNANPYVQPASAHTQPQAETVAAGGTAADAAKTTSTGINTGTGTHTGTGAHTGTDGSSNTGGSMGGSGTGQT
jgi:sec-independent protein translocase protein TatA